MRRGVVLRLTALADDANVAALFYSREQPLERYNMADTLKAQHTAHLTTGCVCYSDMGRILCSVIADTCGWHDPLCGLTDAHTLAARYGATRFQEQRNSRYVSGREAMLVELGKYGLNERDLVANINFFSKVVVDDSGAMRRVAGHCACRPVPGPALRNGHHRAAARRSASAGHGCALRARRPAYRGAARAATRGRRCVPHALSRKRARLRQYRAAVRMIDTVVPAGEPWMGVVRHGQTFRIVDLEGNQAVDTLFYNADDTHEHYSAQNTIQAQGRIYLTTGSVLVSNRGRPMLRIEADTCGRHDTLGGACSSESNTVRYALEKRHMHSCRDNFLRRAGAPFRPVAGHDQARPALEHQLLHERARDCRRVACVSPTASRPRAGTWKWSRSWTRWC